MDDISDVDDDLSSTQQSRPIDRNKRVNLNSSDLFGNISDAESEHLDLDNISANGSNSTGLEVGSGNGNENDAQNIVLEKLLQHTENVSKDILLAKIKSQGIKNLSDFEFIECYYRAFSDIMTPVQIGKLKTDLKNLKSQPQSSKESGFIIDFHKIFSEEFISILLGAEPLTNVQRTKVIEDVASHLHLHFHSLQIRMCLKTANNLLLHFNSSVGGKNRTPEKLAGQIYNRWKYLKRLSLQTAAQKQKDRGITSVLFKFNPKQNFGIDPQLDLPSEYPAGENTKTQLEKKEKLIQMYKSGSINSKEVLNLMMSTYVSQRISVNEGKNMDQLLQEWPFFGKFRVLQEHFAHLMKLDSAKFIDRMNEFLPVFYKYLVDEGNKTRKGTRESMPEKIREVLKRFEELKNDQRDAGMEFITVLEAVIVKLETTRDWLFLHFEETSSIDEIQASPKLPSDGRPRVAVLGEDILTSKCLVVVEKRVISTEFLSPIKAVFSAFFCYWILKMLYPKNFASVLHFLEREVFQIEPYIGVGGSNTLACNRVERQRTAMGTYKAAPKKLSAKYLTMMEEYETYLTRWQAKKRRC